MKNISAIENYINKKINIEFINECIKNDRYDGVCADEIEKELGIIRNNASTFLNQLFKQGKLIKINTRPVSFFPKDILVKYNVINDDNINIVLNLEEFKNKLKSIRYNNSGDPFNDLIGNKNSLLNQISQAKAALMYPPKGLHTLILGESGVGKSTFALKMYEYARLKKNLNENEFPYISFNCSDYFNNPQLLLSQLFGHAKGAFTGADTEKAGLVEKANGGILFLDEVHRLPPDGQEMLFYLMDKGEYHKLGESSNPRKSNVMIIAATTEDPKINLLTTFLRRIPVIITLPSFREKSIEERVEIIQSIFVKECINLNSELKISCDALKALAVYPFKNGNIGQLKSEIKLLCARSYFDHIQNNKQLFIEFEMLNKEITDYVFGNTHLSKEDKYYLDMFDNYITLAPECTKNNINILSNDKIADNIYEKINKTLESLKEKNLSKEEIETKIRILIEDHFKNVIKNLNISNTNRITLYKVIPREVVDTCFELISLAEKELDTIFSSKFIYALAFHINALLQRISENKYIVNPDILKVRIQYSKEYAVSKLLVKRISDKFGIIVPEDEKGFLTLLLANNKLNTNTDTKIGIITICHGESTASSMADVVNKLLNTNIIKAINMPLEADVQSIYEKFKNTALKVNKEHGILLLVDMGSLCNFGVNFQKESGIKVKTINNISTLLLLEAARKILYSNDDLESIYNSIMKLSGFSNIQTSIKKKAILTFCVTGQGAGLMAKKIIYETIKDEFKNEIEIISTNYFEVENNIGAFLEKYDIIACIGSIKPNINIPYYPINKILNSSFKEEFNKLIDARASSNYTSIKDDLNKSVYESSKEILEQYLKYVNPKIAIVNIKEFIKKLELDDSDKNKDNIIDLIVHMGCMLDRIIHGEKVKFENVLEFKEQNIKEFDHVKDACEILEKEYNITISDDEICYIIKVLKR